MLARMEKENEELRAEIEAQKTKIIDLEQKEEEETVWTDVEKEAIKKIMEEADEEDRRWR